MGKLYKDSFEQNIGEKNSCHQYYATWLTCEIGPLEEEKKKKQRKKKNRNTKKKNKK